MDGIFISTNIYLSRIIFIYINPIHVSVFVGKFKKNLDSIFGISNSPGAKYSDADSEFNAFSLTFRSPTYIQDLGYIQSA